MKDFKNPVDFYIGKSQSHQLFRSQLVKEKILLYQLNENRELLSRFYKREIEDKLARYGDRFSIGMISKVISKTQAKLIQIFGGESLMIPQNYPAFASHFFRRTYCEINRIFSLFQVNLYEELRAFHSHIPEVTNLTYRNPRIEGFEKIGLSLIPSQGISIRGADELSQDLIIFDSTRNLIEHKDGNIDSKYIQQTKQPHLNEGEQIDIDIEKIGDALALVDLLGDDLNIRAEMQYPLHTS